jgi:hypothetical protein
MRHVTALSGNVITVVDPPPGNAGQHAAAGVCKHRGEPDGSCVEKLCCGFRRKTKTPAFRCELLNTRCVERIVAYEPNVVTCATCADREPVAD